MGKPPDLRDVDLIAYKLYSPKVRLDRGDCASIAKIVIYQPSRCFQSGWHCAHHTHQSDRDWPRSLIRTICLWYPTRSNAFPTHPLFV